MINNEIRMKERLNIELTTDLILDGKFYVATIENLSDTGIKVRIVTADEEVQFLPHAIIELQLETKEGVSFRMTCRVVWSIKKEEDNTFTDVGLEITKKPREYDELLKNLDMKNIFMLSEDYEL